MSENDSNIPQSTSPAPEAPTTTPVAVDAPPIDMTPPAMSPQDQIDAEAEAEVKAELERIMADQQGTTTDEGDPANTPVVGQPEIVVHGEQPEPKAPVPAEEPASTPADKARLDAERAAFGKLGGRIQQLEAKLAERDAKLAEFEARLAKPAEPAAATPSEPAGAPSPAAHAPSDLVNSEITDEERKALLGDDWEHEWGKDGADEEVRKQRRAFAFYGGTQQAVREQVRAEISAERESARKDAALDAFLAALDEAIPEAAELDRNAATNGFGKHLDEFLPGTMSTRRQTLSAALDVIQRSDASREERDRALEVAKSIYSTFSNRSSSSTPKTASIDPAKLAMPKISGTAATPAPADKATWSEADIEAALTKAAESDDPSVYDRVQAWATQLYLAGKVRK